MNHVKLGSQKGIRALKDVWGLSLTLWAKSTQLPALINSFMETVTSTHLHTVAASSL